MSSNSLSLRRRLRTRDAESGLSSIPLLFLLILTIIIIVGSFHAFLSLYTKAVVRGAVDEGARAGAPEFAGAADCAVAANRVLGELLGPEVISQVRVACSSTDDASVAQGVGYVPSFLPGVLPDIQIDITAVVTKEPEYEP